LKPGILNISYHRKDSAGIGKAYEPWIYHKQNEHYQEEILEDRKYQAKMPMTTTAMLKMNPVTKLTSTISSIISLVLFPNMPPIFALSSDCFFELVLDEWCRHGFQISLS
jgi:hypothetical protein